MPAPLEGIKVVEVAGIGPGPFCGMVLADFGAEVVRVERIGNQPGPSMQRGKKSIEVDLKKPEGVELVLRLCEKADVIIEPYRPGVMERLGLGPDVVFKRNPNIIYGRMTGFGQEGKYANMAGHDANYVATSGLLSALGHPAGPPAAPINLMGDFAGGGMMLALGITMALFERDNKKSGSGKGQVIDCAMCDGAAYVATFLYQARFNGMWGPRGTNMLDHGAPYSTSYETMDGKFMSVQAIEPQFYSILLKLLGLPAEQRAKLEKTQNDRKAWPSTKRLFTGLFLTKTRDEWEKIFDGQDACTVPVFELEEILPIAGKGGNGRSDPLYSHAAQRQLLGKREGTDGSKAEHWEPRPAPRFSRSQHMPIRPAPVTGRDTKPVLKSWLGLNDSEVSAIESKKIVVSRL
ncbi:CoA-transferase family III [Gonapodya prolifera JEL478]|uniref:CoA-transferase family III n=1 Tax=Gonapodya prolifera (strain JEL478) TaxID=1344416 RepID=A0A139ABZ0_GONPJ|nr:CoA-transferase family III [Gonapodya prolifera JEL478]|eukprot:KXS14316.1 CoA-transferase family III [Gonapodya prolifera JEL478]